MHAKTPSRTTIIFACTVAAVGWVMPASSQALFAAGFERAFDLGDSTAPAAIALPPGKTASQMVAMGVSPNDVAYFYWSDGTMSIGSDSSSTAYRAPMRYTVAPGLQPTDIVGIAVDYNEEIYVYYQDGTASVGTPYDLDAVDSDVLYRLPRGYISRDILGAAILDDDIMLFMRDGTFHVTDIDDYDEFTPTSRFYSWDRYSAPRGTSTAQILGLDFADSDGRLYTFFDARQPTPNPGIGPQSADLQNRILNRSDNRRRRARPVQTQPQQLQQDGVELGPGGITLRKDGFTLTLPTAPR